MECRVTTLSAAAGSLAGRYVPPWRRGDVRCLHARACGGPLLTGAQQTRNTRVKVDNYVLHWTIGVVNY
jgi:hypothetical protein